MESVWDRENPKLMTLQALETIRSCDLIVLPAVSKEECYAYRIVEQVCPEIADMPLLCMPFPMIKDAQKLELAHKRIYDAMEDYLRQGLRVGMLTIGDPGIYSTYMYMHRCAADAGWEARIVSGVPSFCAVAARLGISLGEKDEEIHIIPAAYDVRESLGFHGTRIYMKSGKNSKSYYGCSGNRCRIKRAERTRTFMEYPIAAWRMNRCIVAWMNWNRQKDI